MRRRCRRSDCHRLLRFLGRHAFHRLKVHQLEAGRLRRAPGAVGRKTESRQRVLLQVEQRYGAFPLLFLRALGGHAGVVEEI